MPVRSVPVANGPLRMPVLPSTPGRKLISNEIEP